MIHRLGIVLVFLLTIITATAPRCAAQEEPAKAEVKKKPQATAAKSGELDAIRQAARDFVSAFNSQDAESVAAHWTEDGDYIDEDGQEFAGREAIQAQYAQFFEQHDGVKLKVVIDSLRLLSPEAAIEDGRAMLDPAPLGAPAITKYTAVHIKSDGKWRMSTVRDARIETPSAYRNLEDLQWLIGTWTAEEHGAKYESVCRWVANKSFVQRNYALTHADHTTSSGVQLIGFNPQSGRVQSWTFTSEGGHAVGVWTPTDGGWQAEVHGITGEGVSTTAVNHLTRIDDDAYAWQSVQRTAGGVELSDTDEVVLKRQRAK